MDSVILTTNAKTGGRARDNATSEDCDVSDSTLPHPVSDGLLGGAAERRAASPELNAPVVLRTTVSPPSALQRRPIKVLSRKISSNAIILKSVSEASLVNPLMGSSAPGKTWTSGEGERLSSKRAAALDVGVDTDSAESPGQQRPRGASGIVLSRDAGLESLHAIPPADSDDGGSDALDPDSPSSTFFADASIAHHGGAKSRPAASVTSFAGKRHTKTVLVPGAPHAGAGVTAVNGGAGSHHYSDCTLRYRTDLDKQVIHFMFERHHSEQAHPTSSTTLSTPPPLLNACSTEEAGGRAGEAPRARSSLEATAPTIASASASCQPTRTQRCTVEEVVVPPNGEGEDKNTGLGHWNFFWMHVGRVRHALGSTAFRLQEHQIINHFPDHAELTRKDLMYKNIKRYLREHQANNYARLTLYTATDWVSASAGPSAFASAGGVPADPNRFRSFCFADSVPLTYNIPNDMNMFKEKFQRRRGTQWIVKPTSRSQGKGIFLIDDVRTLQRRIGEKKEPDTLAAALATSSANRASLAVSSGLQMPRSAPSAGVEAGAATASGSVEGFLGSPTSPKGNGTNPTSSAGGSGSMVSGSYIVSRYISNPLLIGGKKFDLRLYVLVTSYKPLVAYLHEDGFARFCATRYAARSLAQEDLGSHLTNVALQKSDEHYNTSHGGKWSFQNLFLYIQRRYGPYTAEGMVRNIQFLIFHSLKAVEPVIFNEKHSYELYGYDILIDDQINPHLIEVNASPSMSTTTVADRLLKEQVLTDTLKIVLPPGYPATAKGMPYWEYRLRTDLTTQLQTGFTLLRF